MKKETTVQPSSVSPAIAKQVLAACAFTGRPADYRMGIIGYNKKRLFRDMGAVVKDKVLDAIDNIQSHCFGTSYWAVVMDLDGNIIYRADEADKDRLSAKEGWRQYVAQHSR